MNRANIVDRLIKDIKERLTLDGKNRVFNEGKELRPEFMKEKAEAEAFTREFLIDKIFSALELEKLPEKSFETPQGHRSVDYWIKSKRGRFLVEAKPLNADLFEKSKDGGVNQIKGLFKLAEVKENYDFGVATNGLRWIFIDRNEEIVDDLNLEEQFDKIKEFLVGKERVVSPKTEEEISKKFYDWYNALLHGGRYKDHENKQKTISEEDCLVNNVIGVRELEEREQIAQVVMNRLIFIKFLQSKGIIEEDVLKYLSEVKEDELTPKLRQLFFGAMNTPEDDRFDIDERFKDIPYLNGSLFVHTEVETKNIDYKVKAEILKKVIEFLDSFKFVHKEELGNGDSIDPEILGYIFERAMTATDRKGTGAYYTPKPITKYISENTIYPLIIDKTNEILKTEKGYKETELIEDIEELFILPATTLNDIWNRIILKIRVLDNACGSGAFLLAAANILFELNRQINDKLGLRNSDTALKKLILINNLYGVDINPNGIEIAKLRLWLWLVDSYEPERIEPLPNIDYNLRVGNSLIGYVDLSGFKETKLTLSDWLWDEEKSTLDVFLKQRNDLIRKYKRAEGEEAKELKGSVQEFDEKINDLLNADLYKKLREKKIKISREEFLKLSPFHWGFEFYDVFDLEKSKEGRGFDVVIGNPPYVELNKIEYGYLLPESKNLYDEFMRVSIKKLLYPAGMFGFIHANSAYCQPKYKAIRHFLKEHADNLTIINFAIRPQPVFKGVMQRTAITICRKDISGAKRVKTSRYIRLTEGKRKGILSNPPTYDCSEFAWGFEDFIPKIGNEFDYQIFKKVFDHKKSLGDILNGEKGVSLFYHDSGESYWTKLLTYELKGIRNGKEVKPSHWFELKVNQDYANFVTCAINSTLFYWFWLTISDCRDLTQNVIKQFPILSVEAISSDILKQLKEYSQKLMECYKENSSYVEKRKGYKSLEFKVNMCKKLINEIDRLIGRIYGLTDEEIEYLIGYDLEMRKEKD